MAVASEAPPVPDPTTLTTNVVQREVERVQELMMAELNGMEREADERFKSVDQKFDLVEKQRVEQKTDTKDAVDAAFSAAKEAVREQTTASDRAIAKSEASMLEQLKQLGTTFTTSIEAMRRDVDDLKERIGEVQQQRIGRQESTTEQRVSIGQIIAIVSVVLLAVSIAIAGIALGTR